MILIAILLMSSPNLFATDIGSSDSILISRVDTYLTKSVSNGFSGAVLVAKDGKILIAKGYGLADRKHEIQVESSTVFNIGSVTKQFTAAAILKLVEQEKITTSDTLAKFFDDVPEDKKNITIHQLLTHTAGISPQTGGPRYEQASRERFLREFFETELDTKPGSRFEYANAGYILLAAIVEYVSGQAFEQFLSQYLFKPAGMINTGYTRPEWMEHQLAHGYYYSVAEKGWIDWGTTPDQWGPEGVSWYGIGKGDIQSTVEDLFRWHQALQLDEILKDELRVLYETPFVPENSAGTSHYAYGWAIMESERGSKVVTHNGSNGLFFADFIRFVEDDVVIIYLTNAALPTAIDDVTRNISRMVFEPTYEPKVVSKISYELIFEFIKENKPDKIGALPGYLEQKLGSKLEDRRVFNQIGYQLLKEQRCDWSIALLQLNVQLFPNDGNLFDSLGEVAMGCGQNGLAVESFNRALEIAPIENCGWCDNSRKHLLTISK